MRVVNFSEARNNLKRVIDQVVKDANYSVISGRDHADAVLMSLDTFNSLMETVHLLFYLRITTCKWLTESMAH